MTGADIIIRVLAEQGVDTIFGYSGGAILPTYDAIFRHNQEQQRTGGTPMNLIVPANEQGAGFMAAGYARATGKTGVFIVTSGPGATNSVTPIRDCFADSVPVVLICGQVPRSALGTDAFQEAPVFNIMAGCAKSVFLVMNPEELEATVRTAFELAQAGRPGPVVIDIPKDVQTWNGSFRGHGVLPCRGYRDRTQELLHARVSADSAAKFFEILRSSERPLIYAGGGVIKSDATVELRTFAARFKIPVVTTLQGLGAFDTTDPLSLHMLGMHGTPYANYAVEDCDCLLAVGARFDDRVAGHAEAFAPNAVNIAHIDIDAAEIGRVKRVTWAHIGTAKTALQDLLGYGTDFNKPFSEWVANVQELRCQFPLDYNRQSDRIQPQYVFEILNRITHGEAIICTGVGQHQMWAAQCMDYKYPRSFLSSGSMGTMGFGLPAAIGAWIGQPQRLVIDVDGDSSIRMNIGELETASTYGVPVKILLLNNNGDGMVRQWQKLFYAERLYASDKSLHTKDFIRTARADGFDFAMRVDKNVDVARAVQSFVAHQGPALLEVMIDPNAAVYPMVGPGEPYSRMINGDHIRSRVRP
jgi:acetolactate synthase-1/2/3 large subunit